MSPKLTKIFDVIVLASFTAFALFPVLTIAFSGTLGVSLLP